jgi:hypothetical protein
VSRDEQHDRQPALEHEAILRAAWTELRQHPFAEAVARIRTEARHATRALAWARLVDAAIARTGPGPDLDAFLLQNPELRGSDPLLAHYSPDRLDSERARREFVLPDRKPLPRAIPLSRTHRFFHDHGPHAVPQEDSK